MLDAACGSGSLTLTAKAAAGPKGKVVGVDAAPEMIAVAKEKAARARLDVAFEVGLIEKLAFPDASFDVVISRLAIHHLPDDLKRAGFAEFLRVLKPGGRLLIADFKPPTNPVLRHITSGMIGSHMMESDVWSITAGGGRRICGSRFRKHPLGVPGVYPREETQVTTSTTLANF